MPRVIGIDPGTVSVDLCGLEDDRVFLERSIPTADALADPAVLAGILDAAAPLDLVAGPSGYGLPLVLARDLSEDDVRLAYLAVEGERGGIGGLRAAMHALAACAAPVVLTPGVIHLGSVPAHRKVNRVDMGTADKVSVTALAIHEEAARRRCAEREVSAILLELGGAFTAAVAIDQGRIVDGIGGSSGPLGLMAAGALDGEVAFLAGSVPRALLFQGGAATIAGEAEAAPDRLAHPTTAPGRLAWDAYVESAIKAVAALGVSAPRANDVVLSGRVAEIPDVREEFAHRLSSLRPAMSVRLLGGFASSVKHAAQGAALLADGLAGGRSSALVDVLGIREASGTVLDYLYVIDRARARRRLGLG